MRKLLALDQSSRITGWAVFYDNKLIKHGKFEMKDDDIGERLYKIRQAVIELIEEFEINELAFEDIQLQNNVTNNVQTFKVLAEVFGVIYELAVEREIPHTAVLAGTWKSTLGIKGKTRPEQKRNAQEYVVNTYAVRPTQDECDAICIGTHIISGKKLVKTPDHDWTI